MAYEFEIKELQAQPTASIRERAADVGAVFGRLLGEVFAHLGAHGVQPAGPPYARFHGNDGEGFDLEVGIAVATPIAGDGRVVPGELPVGRAAVTVHTGPYDQLVAAHDALRAWLARQDFAQANVPWEVYLTDPNQERDPSKWRTEVIYPVR